MLGITKQTQSFSKDESTSTWLSMKHIDKEGLCNWMDVLSVLFL